jgi:predicted HTH domain antitoxin
MNVTLDIPAGSEVLVRNAVDGALDTYAREALAVRLYREHRVTKAEAQAILGCSRFDFDALLKQSGGHNEFSADEIWEHAEQIRGLSTKAGH